MIHYHSDLFFRKYRRPFDEVAEFGSNIMNLAQVESAEGVRSVDYYIQCRVESFDLDGNKAHALDLSKALPEKFWGKYDIVTDFGTGEHVKSWYWVVRNAFDLLRVGGIGLHVNPKTGHFPGHQLADQEHPSHHLTLEFWDAYCEAAGLEKIESYVQGAYHNWETGVEVYCAYRKLETSSFPRKAVFTKIEKAYVFPE